MYDILFQSIAFAGLGGRPDVPSGLTQWKLTSCSCRVHLGCPLLGGASTWSFRGLRLQGLSPCRPSESSPFHQRAGRGAWHTSYCSAPASLRRPSARTSAAVGRAYIFMRIVEPLGLCNQKLDTGVSETVRIGTSHPQIDSFFTKRGELCSTLND